VVVPLPEPDSVIVTPCAQAPDVLPEIEQLFEQVKTVNCVALLVAVATPNTVTITFPVPVAPAGTVTVMLVECQLVGVAVTPLTVTVLEPCA
jgi:hypothetical protein